MAGIVRSLSSPISQGSQPLERLALLDRKGPTQPRFRNLEIRVPGAAWKARGSGPDRPDLRPRFCRSGELGELLNLFVQLGYGDDDSNATERF